MTSPVRRPHSAANHHLRVASAPIPTRRSPRKVTLANNLAAFVLTARISLQAPENTDAATAVYKEDSDGNLAKMNCYTAIRIR